MKIGTQQSQKLTAGGYSLVELMITLAVVAVIVLVVFGNYQMQTTTYASQSEISKMQQGLRGAIHVLTWDLHNALRDPSPHQNSRFTNNNRLVNVDGDVDYNGMPQLEFTSIRLDNDLDGVADTPQTITYAILDPEADGIPGLYRRANPPDLGEPDALPKLVADSVQAIGFAFAFDSNGDNVLERYNGDLVNGRILWAVDSNNDGELDAILDVNDDGVIDEKDDWNNDGRIDAADDNNHNSNIPTPVSYDAVRAVRIFLLMVSERPINDHTIDTHSYAVGNRVIRTPNDRLKRRMMTVDVALRNYIR
ncbi:MAG: PilW family protein [Desulfobacteraceae bacterium]|nr:PilW family protein [Desulfobacteraceae bacterium]